MGWRMGGGEDYRYRFFKWYKSLSVTQQTEYQQLFPEPKQWAGFYAFDEKTTYRQSTIYVDKDWNESICAWQDHGLPKYSLSYLQQDITQGKQPEYLLFHEDKDTDSIDKSCLSQCWPCEFMNFYDCQSAEQYMMATKAQLFDDDKILEKILASNDPAVIKKFGKEVQNFNKNTWEKHRHTIVLNGNFDKFHQNPELLKVLLATDDKVLVVASPTDTIWGIGLAQDHKGAQNPLNWQGQNLLGFALMEVRDELKRVWQSEHLIDWDS